MIKVRTATARDRPAIMSLLVEKFWPEHDLGGIRLPMSPDRILENITNCLATGQILLAEDAESGRLVGSLALHPFKAWWTDEEILADGWFFVDPEWRSSDAGRRLLTVAKAYAAGDGRPFVLGVFNSHDSDRKGEFFARHGMTRIGGWFIYAPPVAAAPPGIAADSFVGVG